MSVCLSLGEVGFDHLVKVVSMEGWGRTVCLGHLAPLLSMFHEDNEVRGKTFLVHWVSVRYGLRSCKPSSLQCWTNAISSMLG